MCLSTHKTHFVVLVSAVGWLLTTVVHEHNNVSQAACIYVFEPFHGVVTSLESLMLIE